MSTESCCDANPFESPSSTPVDVPRTQTQQADILATADLLLEQLKQLEDLCSTVEERVQHKRGALKELEYLIFGSNTPSNSPCSPACPANTPINSRLRLVSPRLRGLFDLRGPGQANLDATQSCLDYSPDVLAEVNLSRRVNPSISNEWVDDDEEALLCPFDDKYAVRESLCKEEKALPAIPHVKASGVLESRIPKKAHVRKQASTSRRLTGRPSGGAVARSASHRHRPSIRSVKATNAGFEPSTRGTMRRGSWKRSILENAKAKGAGGSKALPAVENERAQDGTRTRKEKRKALWSIYSVCSELGLGGTHQTA